MLFNSYIFVLLFLPLCVSVYYLLYRMGAKKLPQIWLLGMSLWFYGYFNPSYLTIICGSIVVNYLLSRAIIKYLPEDATETGAPGGAYPGAAAGSKNAASGGMAASGSWRVAGVITAIGITANLGVLFYFKYMDFFIANLNSVFSADFALKNIVLPLGISFFTFQQMSFIMDTWHGETKGYNFLEYAVFVSFFPQLVAGPIVLHNEIIPQLRDERLHTPDTDKMSRGLWLFAVGMAKKVLIADTFGKMVTLGYGGVEILTTTDVLLVMFAYTFQMYYDFSGYSDMATGMAGLFGMTLPLNFDSPYQCSSIIEHWQRWHMTLTRFLRKYVYFPLGGSRRGELRTDINIMLVYLISGFWHGAGWTYILWGGLHGFAQVVNRKVKKQWDRLPKPLGCFITFVFIAFVFVIFRSESLGQAYIMYRKVAKLENFAITETFLECLTLPEVKIIEKILGLEGLLGGRYGLHMWGFFALAIFMTFFCKNAQKAEFKCNIRTMLATAFMLFVCIFSFSGISTFLYFNF